MQRGASRDVRDALSEPVGARRTDGDHDGLAVVAAALERRRHVGGCHVGGRHVGGCHVGGCHVGRSRHVGGLGDRRQPAHAGADQCQSGVDDQDVVDEPDGRSAPRPVVVRRTDPGGEHLWSGADPAPRPERTAEHAEDQPDRYPEQCEDYPDHRRRA